MESLRNTLNYIIAGGCRHFEVVCCLPFTMQDMIYYGQMGKNLIDFWIAFYSKIYANLLFKKKEVNFNKF